MSAKEQLTYLSYAGGWTTVRRMPEKTAYRTFGRIADRMWRSGKGGVPQLEKNLQRVFPDATHSELRDLSRAGMNSYMRYWCDAFRIIDWDRDRIVDTFECVHAERIGDPVKAGTGVVVALCHMGNWDHAGAWGALTQGPLASVAEKLKPEKLFKRFVAYRESLGMTIFGLGDEAVMDGLTDFVRDRSGIVALLADRDLTPRGVDVTFFGEPTRMPAGPASLALRTGAPLHSATLWYDRSKAYTEIGPRIEVPEWAPSGDDARDHPRHDEAVALMTAEFARSIEAGIRAHPEDWHMLQKLWLADLDAAKLAESDARGGRRS